MRDGRGGSSDVFLVSRRGELFAMKRVSKARLKPKQRQMVAEEMAILKQIQHPFVRSRFEYTRDDHGR